MSWQTATAWRRLVLRYAEGRTPCNCAEAYYDSNGQCAGGCSTNKINAKEEIAAKVEREFQNSATYNQKRRLPK